MISWAWVGSPGLVISGTQQSTPKPALCQELRPTRVHALPRAYLQRTRWLTQAEQALSHLQEHWKRPADGSWCRRNLYTSTVFLWWGSLRLSWRRREERHYPRPHNSGHAYHLLQNKALKKRIGQIVTILKGTLFFKTLYSVYYICKYYALH